MGEAVRMTGQWAYECPGAAYLMLWFIITNRRPGKYWLKGADRIDRKHGDRHYAVAAEDSANLVKTHVSVRDANDRFGSTAASNSLAAQGLETAMSGRSHWLARAGEPEIVQRLLESRVNWPILRPACKCAFHYALHFDVSAEVSSVVRRPVFHQ